MARKLSRLALGIVLIAGAVLAAGFLWSRAAGLPDSGARSVANPPVRPALPPPDEAARRLTVPAGFAIRIFAEGLFAGQAVPGFGSTGPRFMAFGPDGALYISDDHGGRIYRVVYTGAP